eukprot:TRINITY_DN4824_c0_g1_i1.p1 TRINITY_DN4824_c0_g1~~TRINITY_DN4824_c0_g1_i1.p1  ORF type:complete len:329 (-),score=87.50 TRINITY_DN4824_c0_g1_i1:53-1039(-)
MSFGTELLLMETEMETGAVYTEMETAGQGQHTTHPWPKRFPNTGFGVALGLLGNSILWKRLAAPGFTHWLGTSGNWVFWCGGVTALVLATMVYAWKVVMHFEMVRREWNHPIRCYFFITPVIATMMLSIGIPATMETMVSRRVLWAVTAGAHVLMVSILYQRWMYCQQANLGQAGAPYMLSVVGWFLSCVLAQQLKLDEHWGLNLPAMTFGAGSFFLTISMVSIFLNFHSHSGTKRGHPSLFLLIAPPSVAALAVANFEGKHFGAPSQAILGFCLMLLILFSSLCPRILAKPEMFGVYLSLIHISEPTRLLSISYAVFCLKKKKKQKR